MEYRKTEPEDTLVAKIQADVFEMSTKFGLDSRDFVERFMGSKVAQDLDAPYHKIRWAGKMYVMAAFLEEIGRDISIMEEKEKAPEGEIWNPDAMFWIGFTYRYWASLTGQWSREIYAIADGERMYGFWPRLHTDNCKAAVNYILEHPEIRMTQRKLLP